MNVLSRVLSIRTARALFFVGFALAVVHLAAYVAVACARIAHPFELEWIEGPCVRLMDRILAGRAIYEEPSLDFIGPPYAPLYFYVSAAMAKWLGIGFFPLRLVSFLSSLGCFALIAGFVRRETGCGRCGLFAAGLFASCFVLAGAWYDTAHVDSLYLCLLLASAYVLRRDAGPASAFAAAILGVLAFLSKQTAMPMLLALSLYAFYKGSGPSRWTFALTVAVGLVVTTVAFNRATNGWYWYYVFSIPGQGTMLLRTPWWVMKFWTWDMPDTAIALGAMVYWIARRALALELDDVIFYGLLLGAVIVSCWSARIHAGGYLNVLMPAHAWFAIGAGFALHEFVHAPTAAPDSAPSAAPFCRLESPAIFAALAIVQLAIGVYDPRQQIPPATDVAAGNRLVERIRAIPGDVYVAYHPYLAFMAGKPWVGHLEVMDNIPRGTPLRLKVEGEIEAAVREKRFAAIVTDRRRDRGFRRRLIPTSDEFYAYRGSLVTGEELWPMTGLLTRPQDLYVALPATGATANP